MSLRVCQACLLVALCVGRAVQADPAPTRVLPPESRAMFEALDRRINDEAALGSDITCPSIRIERDRAVVALQRTGRTDPIHVCLMPPDSTKARFGAKCFQLDVNPMILEEHEDLLDALVGALDGVCTTDPWRVAGERTRAGEGTNPSAASPDLPATIRDAMFGHAHAVASLLFALSLIAATLLSTARPVYRPRPNTAAASAHPTEDQAP